MSLLDRLHVDAKADDSGLSPATFAELRRFVHERTGIYFRDNKRYLMESRLNRRLRTLGLPDFPAYLDHLRAATGRAELTELINAITINETYFFRHAEQHAHFVNTMLPQLVEARLARGQRRVRIWSAACSTGDEAYTLALLIREHLATRYPQVTFELVGSDIDTEVVRKAQSGVYGAYAVRNVPQPLLRKYFDASTDGRTSTYELDPRIRQMVTFHQANLTDATAMQRMRDIDAVFCANVLIYFDQQVKERVAASIYQSLCDGGYLFVGTSETLYGVTQAFQPVRTAEAVAYRKVAASTPKVGKPNALTSRPAPSVGARSAGRPAPRVGASSTSRPTPVTPRPAPGVSRPAPRVTPRAPSGTPRVASPAPPPPGATRNAPTPPVSGHRPSLNRHA